MDAPLQIKPISEARGKMKMSSIPDTAVPILRTVRNMLQHAEYKYVWSTDLLGSSGNSKSKPSILRSPIFELIPTKLYPLFKENQWFVDLNLSTLINIFHEKMFHVKHASVANTTSKLNTFFSHGLSACFTDVDVITIRYFEIGLNPCDDEASLFLCSKGIDFSCNKFNHFNLCFEVGLYSEEGNKFIAAKASGVEQVNGDTNGLGWKNLCTYKCIENTPSFHLRATIWTLGELKEGDSDLLPRKDLSFISDNSTRHSLCDDMASLWHEKRSEWTDMVIQVGYRNFPVHRAILAARSRFFQELFKKHREDSCHEKSIRLDGVDLECMELILEYIYTGHIGTSETQKLTDLLELADKLQLSSCKTECFHRLSERLTLQNALALAVLSYKFNVCTELKNRVKRFCLLHKEKLLGSEAFDILMDKSQFQLMCVFGSKCFTKRTNSGGDKSLR